MVDVGDDGKVAGVGDGHSGSLEGGRVSSPWRSGMQLRCLQHAP
jgi:hypothetical protein